MQFIDPQVLENACAVGATESELEFILLRTAPNWGKAVDSAVKGGHLHVLEWMINRRDGRGPWACDFHFKNESCLMVAAFHGQLETMKWLFNQKLFDERCLEKAAWYASRNGDMMMIKWLHNHAKLTYVMSEAARNGHLEMVQWIYENVETDTSFAMEEAARNGHLDVLRWLHQRKCCPDTCTTSTMDGAVDGGHFLIANWLLENCSKGCSHNAPICAADKGNLKMLQWLHVHFNQKFSKAVMDKAAWYGHLDVVKWLHEYRTEGCSTVAMDMAAACGHLDVVQWLHDNRDEGCTRQAMDEAAANGYLDVLKWLHSNRSEGCTRTFGVCDGIIKRPIRCGHYAVVRWLLEHNLDTYRRDLIKYAIWAGNSELVCYLGENFKQYAYDWQTWGASEYELIEAAKQGYLKASLRER
ncbi:hypothetical protein PHMEG_00034310, partial [Phytophthora megakarya]